MSTTPDIVNEISKHGKSESGHVINASTFEQLISYCTGYGAIYNPSKNGIKVASMNALLTTARTAIANEEDKHNAYSIAVDNREILFKPLSNFITKILNALKSSDVTKQKIDDAKTYTRKLSGKRAKNKSKKALDAFISATTKDLTTTDTNAIPSIEQEHKEISVSQMSYDNRYDNLSKLVNLLSTEPGYAPNEAELKVTSLNTLLTTMKTKNSAVINAITALSNARIDRNKILYKDDTGLYDIAMSTKAYVKSVFGYKSPEYKQVSKLKFTKPR